MKCRLVEKNLYSLSENPDSQRLEADIQAHLKSCQRCSRMYTDLQALQKIMTETPDIAFIPYDQVNEIVLMKLKHNRLPQVKKPVGMFQRISEPRIAFSFVALLIIAIIGLSVMRICNRSPSSAIPNLVSTGIQNGRLIVSPSRDSTLSLGPHCTLRLQKGGACAILRHEKAVVLIDLHYGEVAIAALKRSYDTLAVISGDVRTFATGTQFRVDRSDSAVRVSVLEGAVSIRYFDKRETPLKVFETWSLLKDDSAGITERLSLESRQQMTKDFAAMTAANQKINGKAGRLGKETAYAVERCPHELPFAQTKSQSLVPDSEALHQFSIAEKVMQREDYSLAAIFLKKYLLRYRYNSDSAWFDLAFCYTKLRRYSDAIEAYHQVVSGTGDQRLFETALHRNNKILFLKLKNYDKACEGMECYLEKYPRGVWREEELYYYVQLSLFQGNAHRADSLVKIFAAEFPGNCRAQELTDKISSLKP